MTMDKIIQAVKPFIGIAFRGAKWYVQVRYGIPVDEILAGTAKVVFDENESGK